MMQSECDLGLRPRGLRGPGLRGSLVLSGFASGVLTWRVAAGAAVEAEKRIAAAKFEEMRGKLESMEELVKLAGVDGDGRGCESTMRCPSPGLTWGVPLSGWEGGAREEVEKLEAALARVTAERDRERERREGGEGVGEANRQLAQRLSKVHCEIYFRSHIPGSDCPDIVVACASVHGGWGFVARCPVPTEAVLLIPGRERKRRGAPRAARG
eukprot:2838266-Rhodomonas_salina.1